MYYKQPKKIIEFKSNNPQDVRLVDYTEDDFYELLYVAFNISLFDYVWILRLR